MTLILRGIVPSKKNLLRRSRNGGMHYNEEVKAQIEALTWQAKTQFGGGWPKHDRAPLHNPEMEVMFHISSFRQDRDDRFSTVLDCLVKAGVLKNDNPVHNNGKTTLWPDVRCKAGEERVEITIS